MTGSGEWKVDGEIQKKRRVEKELTPGHKEKNTETSRFSVGTRKGLGL